MENLIEEGLQAMAYADEMQATIAGCSHLQVGLSIQTMQVEGEVVKSPTCSCRVCGYDFNQLEINQFIAYRLQEQQVDIMPVLEKHVNEAARGAILAFGRIMELASTLPFDDLLDDLEFTRDLADGERANWLEFLKLIGRPPLAEV